MKRKIIAVVFMLFIILCCFLFFRYIFIYNKGNQLYERFDYPGAIEQYQNALEAHPPHFKECSVRVNLALAMIYNMGEDFAAPENIESSIETLMEARDILLEDGCASDEGVGHSEPAQKLKEEIDKLLEQLQQQQESQSGGSENENDGSQDQQDGQSSVNEEIEQQIQQELQDIQTGSYEERQEYQQLEDDLNSDMNFDYEIDIW